MIDIDSQALKALLDSGVEAVILDEGGMHELGRIKGEAELCHFFVQRRDACPKGETLHDETEARGRYPGYSETIAHLAEVSGEPGAYTATIQVEPTWLGAIWVPGAEDAGVSEPWHDYETHPHRELAIWIVPAALWDQHKADWYDAWAELHEAPQGVAA